MASFFLNTTIIFLFFASSIVRAQEGVDMPETWTQEVEIVIKTECTKAIVADIGRNDALALCGCVVTKLKAEHPNPAELDRMAQGNDSLSMERLFMKYFMGCMDEAFPNQWAPFFKKQFVADCMTNAKTYLKEDQVQPYCDCMTQKVQARYPKTSQALALGINEMDSELEAMAAECLKPFLEEKEAGE